MVYGEPIIRLEIEQMKYQIMHMLSQHNAEIEAEVEKQLGNVLSTFDFESCVSTYMADAIQDAIKHYFSYGHGHDIIRNAISETLDGVLGLLGKEESPCT